MVSESPDGASHGGGQRSRFMTYIPEPARYANATFRRCGQSGLVLPPVSLGLWQNFGGADVFETGRAVIRRAFDRGVTHFDLANNPEFPFCLSAANQYTPCAQTPSATFLKGKMLHGEVV